MTDTKPIYTVEQIEDRCRELGISVNELCQEARINRSILVRWKKELPKSFQILEKIANALEELTRQKYLESAGIRKEE